MERKNKRFLSLFMVLIFVFNLFQSVFTFNVQADSSNNIDDQYLLKSHQFEGIVQDDWRGGRFTLYKQPEGQPEIGAYCIDVRKPTLSNVKYRTMDISLAGQYFEGDALQYARHEKLLRNIVKVSEAKYKTLSGEERKHLTTATQTLIWKILHNISVGDYAQIRPVSSKQGQHFLYAEAKDVPELRARHSGETLKLTAYSGYAYPQGRLYAEQKFSLDEILNKKYHGILLHDNAFYTIISKASNSWREYIKIGRAEVKGNVAYTPDYFGYTHADRHVNTSYKITPQSPKWREYYNQVKSEAEALTQAEKDHQAGLKLAVTSRNRDEQGNVLFDVRAQAENLDHIIADNDGRKINVFLQSVKSDGVFENIENIETNKFELVSSRYNRDNSWDFTIKLNANEAAKTLGQGARIRINMKTVDNKSTEIGWVALVSERQEAYDHMKKKWNKYEVGELQTMIATVVNKKPKQLNGFAETKLGEYFKIEKNWENTSEDEQEEIIVGLFRDGTQARHYQNAYVKLNKQNSYQAYFFGNIQGQPGRYHIRELRPTDDNDRIRNIFIEGQYYQIIEDSGRIKIGKNDFEVTYEEGVQQYIKIVKNKKIDRVSIRVSKTWRDTPESRKSEVLVGLFKDGNRPVNFTQRVLALNRNNNFTGVFDDLDPQEVNAYSVYELERTTQRDPQTTVEINSGAYAGTYRIVREWENIKINNGHFFTEYQNRGIFKEVINHWLGSKEIHITKDWINVPHHNLRNAKVIVWLFKKDSTGRYRRVEDVNPIELNIRNNFTGKFENLPEYDEQRRPIEYMVFEFPEGFEIEGKEGNFRWEQNRIIWNGREIVKESRKASQGNGSVSAPFIIKNINIAKVDVEINKKWVNGNALRRPVSIELKAKVGFRNVPIQEVLSQEGMYDNANPKPNVSNLRIPENIGDNWKLTISNLPKYYEGEEVTYEIEEVNVPEYFDPVVGNTVKQGNKQSILVTNTFNPDKTKIRVSIEKRWENTPDNKKLPVTIRIIGRVNNRIVYDHNEVITRYPWTGEYDVPKYDDSGKEIVYSVEEVRVGRKTPAESGFETVPPLKQGNHFTIINKNNEKVSLEITKEWIDGESLRGDYILVDVTSVPDLKEVIPNAITRQRYLNQRVTKRNGWKKTFSDLPKYHNGVAVKYSVKEKGVPAEFTSVVGATTGVGGNLQKVTITNTFNPDKTKIRFRLNKVWENTPEHLKQEITVQVIGKVGNEVAYNQEHTINKPWNLEVEVPKYNTKGEEITYSIKEIKIGGKPITGFNDKVEGNQNQGFTITNTNIEKVALEVNKAWVNGQGVVGDSITVDVTSVPSLEEVIPDRATRNQYLNQTITKAAGWKRTFDNLPKYHNGVAVKYSVKEKGVPAEFTSVVGATTGVGSNLQKVTITNTFNPDKTKIRFRLNKVWENTPEHLKQEITVQVIGKVGNEVAYNQEHTINKPWNLEVEVPKYNTKGEEITYSIKEIKIGGKPITGFNDKVEGNQNQGFTITNTNIEKVSLEVNKAWVNGQGVVGDSIIVDVVSTPGLEEVIPDQATRNQYLNQTITKAAGWKRTFSNLPKYHNGVAVKYSVKEKGVPAEFTSVVGATTGVGSNLQKVTITNTFNPDKTKIRFRLNKVWENTPEHLKQEITVQVIGKVGNEVAYNQEHTINKPWNLEVEVPKYNTKGEEITYSIKEIKIGGKPITGFNDKVEGNQNQGFTITNTNIEKVSLEVNKAWVNGQGVVGDSIIVDVVSTPGLEEVIPDQATRNQYLNQTITKAAGWKRTFSNLPKYHNGVAVKYSVKEKGVPAEFTSVVGATTGVGGNLQKVTVTNTFNPDKTKIRFRLNKVWENTPEHLKQEITVQVIGKVGNEVAYNQEHTINKPWNLEVEVPKYNTKGEEITYSIKEIKIGGKPITGFNDKVEGNQNQGFTITNTNIEKVSLEVNKAWVNGQGVVGDSITVDVTSVPSLEEVIPDRATRNQYLNQTITKAAGWKRTFDNLPKYHNGVAVKYSVKEKGVPAEFTSVVGATTGVGGNLQKVTVTNTFNPDKTKIRFRLNKVWENTPEHLKQEITVQVIGKVGNEVAYNQEHTINKPWNLEVEVPKYNTKGEEITYSIKEIKIGGKPITGFNDKVEGNQNQGFTITNTNIEKVALEVNKAWVNGQGVVGDSITVDVTSVPSLEEVIPDRATRNQYLNQTITKAAGWKRTFDNLPKYHNGVAVKYSVKEKGVPAEFTSVVGATTGVGSNLQKVTITNTFNPDKTKIRFRLNKVWENTPEHLKQEITVQVIGKVGNEVAYNQEHTINKPWNLEVEVPKYNTKGEEITYSIKEIKIGGKPITGFNDKVEGNQNQGFTITNTNIEKVALEVNKAWVNGQGVVGDSITVDVTSVPSLEEVIPDRATRNQYLNQTITKAAGWKRTFDNLPKYHNGVAVKYSVKEKGVPAEFTSVVGATTGVGSNLQKVTITNTFNPDKTKIRFRLNKVWENTPEHLKQEITVQVIGKVGNEVAYNQEHTINKPWNLEVEVPKYNTKGEEITYSIKEIKIGGKPITGFNDKVEGNQNQGFTITNTNIEKVSLEVNKAWVNGQGVVGDSITVDVTSVPSLEEVIPDRATRNQYLNQTITKAAGWKRTFDNLPKYHNGVAVKYSVKEKGVPAEFTSVVGATTGVGGNLQKVTVTNTFNPDKTKIRFRLNKVWENTPEHLKQEITVQVIGKVGNEVAYNQEHTINKPWNLEVEVPKYNTKGEEITYSIKEIKIGGKPITGFNDKVEGNQNQGFTITNTNIEKVALEVNKAWVNGQGVVGDSITVDVTSVPSLEEVIPDRATRNQYLNQTITKAAGWKRTFDNLPKYHNGVAVKYSVKEKGVPAEFTSVVGATTGVGSNLQKVTITNTFNPDKTKIRFRLNKVWENTPEHLKQEITVQVIGKVGNEVAYNQEHTINKPWNLEVEVPKYNTKGEEITYSIKEIKIGGKPITGFNDKVEGNQNQGFTITNTNIEKVALEVNKAWVNGQGVVGDSITVDVTSVPSLEEVIPDRATRNQYLNQTITKAAGWKRTFDNLPKYHNGVAVKYSVKEKGVPAEFTSVVGATTGVGSNLQKVTITNTFNPDKTKIRFRLNKVWENTPEHLKQEITVQVIGKVGNEVAYNQEHTINKPWNLEVEVPKYNTKGEEITYSIKEIKIGGKPITGFNDKVEGNQNQGFTITNTNIEKVALEVNKAWVNGQGVVGDSITVDVTSVPSLEEVIPDRATRNQYLNQTITKAAGWKRTFDNLPKYHNGVAVKYSVKEKGVPAEFTSVVGATTGVGSNLQKVTITNTFNPDKTKIRFRLNKVWENTPEHLKQEITVQVIGKVGNEVAYNQEHTINKPWNLEVEVPKYNTKGEEITYSIKEIKIGGKPITGFNDKVEGNQNQGFTITNTNIEKVSLEVNKAWVNGQGVVGDSIIVDVVSTPGLEEVIPDQATRNQYLNQTITKAAGWKRTFSNLPKYHNGVAVKYSVKEKGVPAEFTSVVGATTGVGSNLQKVTITNTFNPDKTKIRFRLNKVWESTPEHLKQEITVQVIGKVGNEVAYNQEHKINKPWNLEVEVPKYNTKGEEITYSIKEIKIGGKPITGFNDKVEGNQNQGFTITNTNIEKVALEVNKAWVNGQGVVGDSIIVDVVSTPGLEEVIPDQATRNQYLNQTITKAAGWKRTFSNLPKYHNGVAVKYSVKEKGVPAEFTSVVGATTGVGGNLQKVTITNTFNPDKTKIRFRLNKVWENTPEHLKQEITVQVIGKVGNEVAYNQEHTINKPWNLEVEVPKYNTKGEEITYSIKEIKIGGKPITGFNDKVEGNQNQGFTITNTNIEKVSLEVNKAWVNGQGVVGDSITVDVTSVPSLEEVIPDRATRNQYLNQTITKAAGWKRTFDNLPKYHNGVAVKYSVKEKGVPAEFTSVVGATTGVGGNLQKVTVTNTFNPDKTKIRFRLNKVWENTPEHLKQEITVQVIGKVGNEVAYNQEHTINKPWNLEVEVPKYNTKGEEITYSIKEIKIGGKPITGFNDKVEGNQNQGFTITNTNIEKVSLEVNKAWVNGQGVVGDSITVDVTSVPSLEEVIPDQATRNQYLNQTITKAAGWKRTFSNLPKYHNGVAVKYSVKEKGVPAEFTSVVGATTGVGSNLQKVTITNTFNPDKTKIRFRLNKVWENTPEHLKQEITVQVIGKVGNEVAYNQEHTINKPWNLEVEVPKYNTKGEEITYSIKEIKIGGKPITGFNDKVEGNQNQGFTITNTNIEKVSLEVNKAWVNGQGVVGDSIIVDVVSTPGLEEVIPDQATRNQYLNQTITKAAGWKRTFSNLPKYHNGVAVKYSVKEKGVPAEFTSVVGATTGVGGNLQKVTVTNTFNPDKTKIRFRLNKVWENTPEHLKQEITVQVIGKVGNEVAYNQEHTINKPWNLEVEVPKYNTKGEEITYSIKEIKIGGKPITGFNDKVEGNQNQGFTITNTNIEKVALEVNKAWVNGQGVVGDSIIVDVVSTPGLEEVIPDQATRNQYLNQTITKAAGWKRTFSNLPKYHNGVAVKYSVKEKGVPAEFTSVVGATTGVGGNLQKVTITNTFNPGEKELKIKKVWSIITPEEEKADVTVKITGTAQGAVDFTKEIVIKSPWAEQTVSVPKYAINGIEYSYQVAEIKVGDRPIAQAPFNPEVTSKGDSFTITNTFKGVNTKIKVRKVWENTAEAEKEEITIRILGKANGITEYTEEKVIKAPWDVVKEFEVPKYSKNGVRLTYSVEELAVGGKPLSDNRFIAIVDPASGTDFTITNTRNKKEIPLELIKVWKGVEEAKRFPVRFDVTQVGTDGTRKPFGSVTLKPEDFPGQDVWRFKMPNLAVVSDSGVRYTYEVKETLLPHLNPELEYISNLLTSTDPLERDETKAGELIKTFTITNKLELVDLVVVKDWQGGEKVRGDKIIVTVIPKVDGREIALEEIFKFEADNYRNQEVKADQGWRREFTELPKHYKGKEISYTVAEVNVPQGFTSKVGDTVIATGAAVRIAQSVTVTNTFNHRPDKVEIPVVKRWRGNVGSEVIVKLYRNGVEQPQTLILNSANNWSGVFRDLDKYDENNFEIKYTIKEVSLDPNFNNNGSGEITKEDQDFVITNRNTEKVKVKIEKVWQNSEAKDITFELLADGIVIDQKVLYASAAALQIEFTDLPKYRDEEVNKKAEAIVYTVREKGTRADLTLVLDGDEYRVDKEQLGENHYRFTNTKTPPGDKGFVKVGRYYDYKGDLISESPLAGVTFRVTSDILKSLKEELDELIDQKATLEEEIAKAETVSGAAIQVADDSDDEIKSTRSASDSAIQIIDEWKKEVEVLKQEIADAKEQYERVSKVLDREYVSDANGIIRFETQYLPDGEYSLVEVALPEVLTRSAIVVDDEEHSILDPGFKVPEGDKAVTKFRIVNGKVDTSRNIIIFNDKVQERTPKPPKPTPPSPEPPRPYEPPTPSTPPTPPVPPTPEEIPHEPTPKGNTPPRPEEPKITIPTEKIPESPTELPKTDGIPASMLSLFGAGFIGLGFLFKRKVG